jgi:hypothetical protein
LPIDTVDELHQHLELAIKIELATVPPYLYAMYSIEDPDSRPALLLRSIVVEEMLHAALVTNLLLATGGQPDFSSTRYMTAYPANLPHHHPPLTVDLEPCSAESIEKVFMRIEQPEARDAPVQPDRYETLGQFYHALETAVERLSEEMDLFGDPRTKAQLSDPKYYRPVEFDAEDSGGLTLITDVESACAAIEVIVHQGEGLSHERWSDPSHQELTHYHKLLQIATGTSRLGRVLPVGTNPRTADYPETIQPVSDLFNAVYRGLFLVMARVFDGESRQSAAVGTLYLLMADVLSHLARFLVSQEIPGVGVAAPTFEIREFESSQPLEELITMARYCADAHVGLAPVHEALTGLSLLL